jgi:hypothetical protein
MEVTMKLWPRIEALVSALRLWLASSAETERKIAVGRDAKSVGQITPNGG